MEAKGRYTFNELNSTSALTFPKDSTRLEDRIARVKLHPQAAGLKISEIRRNRSNSNIVINPRNALDSLVNYTEENYNGKCMITVLQIRCEIIKRK